MRSVNNVISVNRPNTGVGLTLLRISLRLLSTSTSRTDELNVVKNVGLITLLLQYADTVKKYSERERRCDHVSYSTVLSKYASVSGE